MKPNSPASGGDCWLRFLTNKKYIRKDGRIHHSALRGALKQPNPPQAWAHELSGRLESLTEDVRREGLAYVEKMRQEKDKKGEALPRAFEFSGVVCAMVKVLRSSIDDKITTDVIYTPLRHDLAHADLVTYRTTPGDLDIVRDWLQNVLKVVRPNEIDTSNQLC